MFYYLHDMSLKILLVTATQEEGEAFRKITGVNVLPAGFSYEGYDIDHLVTGVGGAATAWSLAKWFASNPKPDLVLNAGIAGSYRGDIKNGEVVIPVSDCFADAGIETGSGFQTLFDAGIDDPDRFPFTNGKIIADNEFIDLAVQRFRKVSAITVGTATGSLPTIEKLVSKFNPDIETMEGATFFYICSGEKVPFLAIRAVSNRVEPRNRNKWDIPLAIENLSDGLKEFILMIDKR
jgi:futalosine hydrolase